MYLQRRRIKIFKKKIFESDVCRGFLKFSIQTLQQYDVYTTLKITDNSAICQDKARFKITYRFPLYMCT